MDVEDHLQRGGSGSGLRIAMLGTRGVPAHYGGFETAVEEIGKRLVGRGHEIVVYCRRPDGDDAVPDHFCGMELVTLPAIRSRAVETLSHTGLSVGHLLAKGRTDVVFMFNSANSVFLPLIGLRRIPVAVHVDGLEWKRAKWSGLGQRYYRLAESLAVRWADALIADAAGIADYYIGEFGATTEVISYGAPILGDRDEGRLGALGLRSRQYHLVVARFEPENNVEMIVRGYKASGARYPLIVVGSAPYSHAYSREVQRLSEDDDRIQLVGAIWDQELLDQLYRHSALYLHGHSVGGTNPSLLRAMGAGAPVAAFDVVFNREVLGEHARYFDDASGVVELVEFAESDPESTRDYGDACRQRAAERYRWDDVAEAYEKLALRLASGETRRREVSGRRTGRN